MIARLLAALLYAAGRHRLRGGYCPACYSSPPSPSCPICEGSYGYGDALSPAGRAHWAESWQHFIEVIR